MLKHTRRALAVLLGASMLHWGVASARVHCDAAAAPADRASVAAHVMPAEAHAGHQHEPQRRAPVPAPSAPNSPQDPPDCCVALGSCVMGTFVAPSETEHVASAIADRIGDVITALPASLQPPPDPPPPRG